MFSDHGLILYIFKLLFLYDKIDMIPAISNIFLNELYLSHEVAVIKWITSCHKNRIAIRVITTLASRRDVIYNVSVSSAFSC